jgi:adenosylhomocysteine nucleosidase
MVSGQRILLVAAEPREFDGLLRFCSGVRKLAWPVYWARSGECAGRQFWMAANGAGAAHASKAAEVACALCQPEAIVSMGFCGALDPALEIGDVFVATAVDAAGRRFDVRLPDCDAPHTAGVLVSIDHVAQTAAEKRLLRAAGASAVEMEAAGVAESAVKRGIPLFCVRSVTDAASQSFVNDFNKALLSDGHFGTINLLTSALGNPGRAFPELFRLRRFCRIATRTLGEFIAGCRF